MEVLPEKGERVLESLLVLGTRSSLFPVFVIEFAFVIVLEKREKCVHERLQRKKKVSLGVIDFCLGLGSGVEEGQEGLDGAGMKSFDKKCRQSTGRAGLLLVKSHGTVYQSGEDRRLPVCL